MTTYAFTTSWWTDAEDADRKAPELRAWLKAVRHWLYPDDVFIATSAEPSLKPLGADVHIVPSNTPQTKQYHPVDWCYYLCDVEAMLRFALADQKWDLLIQLESDWVIRDFNRRLILTQFMWLEDWICCPAWMLACENSFTIWKRVAVQHFLNNRKRPNLSETPQTMTAEMELAEVFKGKWWNPWPGLPTMRQEWSVKNEFCTPDSVASIWPLVGRPSPKVRQEAECRIPS